MVLWARTPSMIVYLTSLHVDGSLLYSLFHFVFGLFFIVVIQNWMVRINIDFSSPFQYFTKQKKNGFSNTSNVNIDRDHNDCHRHLHLDFSQVFIFFILCFISLFFKICLLSHHKFWQLIELIHLLIKMPPLMSSSYLTNQSTCSDWSFQLHPTRFSKIYVAFSCFF